MHSVLNHMVEKRIMCRNQIYLEKNTKSKVIAGRIFYLGEQHHLTNQRLILSIFIE